MRSLLIYTTNFLLTAALGVVFVFLEDVQTKFGLSDLEIGLIAGTGFGASFIAQLVLAPLADRGHSAPLAVIAIVSGIVGSMGFAYASSAGTLALSRGLSGIGLGLFSLVARKALIGLDATGGGAKLGILLSTAVAGFITGPLIGALLEPLGFEAPFIFVSAGLMLAGVPATRTILRAEIAIAPVDYSDLGRLLRRPRVQAAMVVQVIVFGFIGVFDAVIDRFLTDIGASTSMVALVILFVGGPMLILPRIAGNLAESRGGSAVMLPALLVLIPAMFGYSIAQSVPVAIIFGVLHGSGESFASVSSQVLVLEVTGAERAAVGAALLDAAGLSSAAVAAFAAPLVYGAEGQSVFVYTALVGVGLASVAYLRVRSAWD
jgi:MFS family permease